MDANNVVVTVENQTEKLEEPKEEVAKTRVVVRFRPINDFEKTAWKENRLRRMLKDADLGDFYYKFKREKTLRDPKKWLRFKVAGDKKNDRILKNAGLQTGHIRLFRNFLSSFDPDSIEDDPEEKIIPFRVDRGKDFGQITAFDNSEKHVFTFDDVIEPKQSDSTQKDAFKRMAVDVVNDVVNGYNGTIFAYGQSGTGKTYSLIGPEPINKADQSDWGTLPLAMDYIFDWLKKNEDVDKWKIRVSFLEIHKEQLKDLICPLGEGKKEKNLRICEMEKGANRRRQNERNKPGRGARGRGRRYRPGAAGRGRKPKGPMEIVVEGLSEHFVSSSEEMNRLFLEAWKQRTKMETNLNKSSSRSHMIATINLSITDKKGGTQNSKLNVVDLAGSEMIKKSGASGETMKEAQAINQSLTVLRAVIDAIGKGNGKHIPYRDSKLTMVLKDSLGGNTKTTIMIAVSPHVYNLPETLTSLQFGKRAKFMKNKVISNKEHSVAELKSHLKSTYQQIEEYKRLLVLNDIKRTSMLCRLSTMQPKLDGVLSPKAGPNLLVPGRSGNMGMPKPQARGRSGSKSKRKRRTSADPDSIKGDEATLRRKSVVASKELEELQIRYEAELANAKELQRKEAERAAKLEEQLQDAKRKERLNKKADKSKYEAELENAEAERRREADRAAELEYQLQDLKKKGRVNKKGGGGDEVKEVESKYKTKLASTEAQLETTIELLQSENKRAEDLENQLRELRQKERMNDKEYTRKSRYHTELSNAKELQRREAERAEEYKKQLRDAQKKEHMSRKDEEAKKRRAEAEKEEAKKELAKLKAEMKKLKAMQARDKKVNEEKVESALKDKEQLQTRLQEMTNLQTRILLSMQKGSQPELSLSASVSKNEPSSPSVKKLEPKGADIEAIELELEESSPAGSCCIIS